MIKVIKCKKILSKLPQKTLLPFVHRLVTFFREISQYLLNPVSFSILIYPITFPLNMSNHLKPF